MYFLCPHLTKPVELSVGHPVCMVVSRCAWLIKCCGVRFLWIQEVNWFSRIHISGFSKHFLPLFPVFFFLLLLTMISFLALTEKTKKQKMRKSRPKTERNVVPIGTIRSLWNLCWHECTFHCLLKFQHYTVATLYLCIFLICIEIHPTPQTCWHWWQAV